MSRRAHWVSKEKHPFLLFWENEEDLRGKNASNFGTLFWGHLCHKIGANETFCQNVCSRSVYTSLDIFRTGPKKKPQKVSKIFFDTFRLFSCKIVRNLFRQFCAGHQFSGPFSGALIINQRQFFVSQKRVSGFPEKAADLRGSPGNFRFSKIPK